MFKIVSIILFSCMLGLFSVSPALAADNFTFSINSLSEFEAGQFPFVSGVAVTMDKNPVSDVKIQVNFPSGIINTMTNSTGQFSITSPTPSDIGEYTITVYAKKDDKYANAQITYQVIENMLTIVKEVPKSVEELPRNDEDVELDPFSKMIKQIEEQKLQVEKKKTIVKEQQQIEEQRLLAEADLQKDLKDAEKRDEFYNPRNVFYRFIEDVDSSVKGIFWQQFLFIENVTKQAHDAKEKALEEDKSSFEAMKIFQEEAAVTQNEIMELNKNLNVKYGNSTSNIQDLFDENGKIPREE